VRGEMWAAGVELEAHGKCCVVRGAAVTVWPNGLPTEGTRRGQTHAIQPDADPGGMHNMTWS
jgi:hypothetical protein